MLPNTCVVACVFSALRACAGQAKITAILVRLGYLDFVRDITIRLCEEMDRSDVVAAITASLLELKELDIVRQINDALVFSGHLPTGAKIAGAALRWAAWMCNCSVLS